MIYLSYRLFNEILEHWKVFLFYQFHQWKHSDNSKVNAKLICLIKALLYWNKEEMYRIRPVIFQRDKVCNLWYCPIIFHKM